MQSWAERLRRWLLPAGVFLFVVAIHFVWRGLFPDADPAQDAWIDPPAGTASSWLSRYIDGGDYWLGYCYGLSLAFGAAAVRRYHAQRRGCDRRLAIGGMTFSGILPVVGCYLVGCCGSPLLPVYLSLFGAAFLPWAKPLVAGLTTLLIGVAWRWLARQARPTCTPEAAPPTATAKTAG